MSREEKTNSLERRILSIFAQEQGRDFSIKQVYGLLGFKERKKKQEIKEIIMQMYSEGKLSKTGTRFVLQDEGKDKTIKKSIYITGVADITSSGLVFVKPDDGSEDIKIPSSNTSHALDGDSVRVYIFPKRKGKKREGQIVDIIERKHTLFAGILKKKKDFALISCTETYQPLDIVVRDYDKTIEDGVKVIVKMTDWKLNSNNPNGEIVKVLGQPGENEVEMQSILFENELKLGFPQEVIQQADAIPTTIPKEEINKREDFRPIVTFTIDPKDAKDFDDALSFELLSNGNYSIGVHIADVSYYVKRNSEIDKEAYDRATSIYLVDRTVPMLPEKLCNGVCSLRPNEDKLCYSVIFEMTSGAKIINHRIVKTIIRSNQRFTYEQAQAIIEASEIGAYNQPSEYSAQITLLWKIAKQLRDERFRNGALKFNSPEYEFDLDDNKVPIAVHIKQSKEANWLVEEFMLLANKIVAQEIGKVKSPAEIKTFVYRVHDEPNQEKVETFKNFASKFGYKISNSSRKRLVKSYNDAFEQSKGKAEQTLISTIALRTMSKAYYSTDNIGHYGLNFDYYTHFTSPIRRYPDLMVHRLLFDYLNGGSSHNKEFYEQCCEHCSQMERKAAEAEHESVKYKQAEYLQDKIGKVYLGEISGVSKWGMFVMIEQNKCEGLVRIGSMKDDVYALDEDNYQIVGQQFGKTFQLGQKVVIRVQGVNMQKKQINFALENQEEYSEILNK